MSEVVGALSYALDITEGQPRGHAVRTCLIEMRAAEKIDLGEDTALAIHQLDEHWDGHGFPLGLAGEEISIVARIMGIAQTGEVFWQHGGVASACAVLRERSGSWFDPALVRAMDRIEHDQPFWAGLAATEPLGQVSAAETGEQARIASDHVLDRVSEAFARVIDAKSPYTSRHSEGVARIACDIADALGLGARVRRDLWRAGLLHDIGKLGVSSRILDKPGKLTDAEWAQMRRHPRVQLRHPAPGPGAGRRRRAGRLPPRAPRRARLLPWADRRPARHVRARARRRRRRQGAVGGAPLPAGTGPRAGLDHHAPRRGRRAGRAGVAAVEELLPDGGPAPRRRRVPRGATRITPRG